VRSRTAGLVIGVAAVLGTMAGAFVLPDPETPRAADPRAGGPTASSLASPSPGPSSGPATKANLLLTSDFTQLGLDVTVQPADDSRINVPSCPGQGQNTVAKLAVSDPPVQRVWDGGSVRAYEEAVTLDSTEVATAVVTRIVRLLESCQQMPPTHFVTGPTHSSELRAGVTVSWVGIVAGELNVAGKAPDDPTKIVGGMGVVRNELRVAVLDLNLCNSGGEQVPCTVGAGDPYQQLETLTNAAALRLG
jgi:hypothetical protein